MQHSELVFVHIVFVDLKNSIAADVLTVHIDAAVASELKALEGQCDRYEPFLPGHYYWSGEGKMHRYYHRDWMDYDQVKDNKASVTAIHDGLEAAVRRQLMSDVPYGVLLSGGLDSSIISAVAEKYADMRIEDDSKTKAYWPRLHSFAVGLKDRKSVV